jgi:hypothetical protein
LIGRIFRVVRTPITLLLLLGVLSYGAWWGYTNVIQDVPKQQAAPCVDQTLSKGLLKSSQVSLKVFNGGDRKGLAGDVGRALRAKGFKVTQTRNTVEKIEKTVIVGANVKDPEVLFVKTFLKDAIVRDDGRVDHSVDVLVGNRYGGFNKDAKTTYRVKAGTVCLPVPAATATPALGG